MQADPHKLDFRSDLLARLPGAGGLGSLGPMGGALPPTHDLTRPPTLFSATGVFTNMSDEMSRVWKIQPIVTVCRRQYKINICCFLYFIHLHTGSFSVMDIQSTFNHQ